MQKKSLSQVFLREDWPCERLVEYLKGHKVQSVVEIGPGNGILTRALLRAGIDVTAIEKDGRFAERLVEASGAAGHPGKLSVCHDDALRFDLAEWAESTPGHKAVCGNIPYKISSPLVLWLLPQLPKLRCAAFMVQLEFGQRLASAPAAKSYGSLSVYVQLRSIAHLEYKVARTCFYPIPKVDSAVVSLVPLSRLESTEVLEKVEQLTRRAFTQRRKMLSNSLSPFLKERLLDSLPVDMSRRCDTLTPLEFVQLAKALDI